MPCEGLQSDRSTSATQMDHHATTLGRRPRVLALADHCNPEWPSLPIVTWKYARELARYADLTLVTQVRNQENISKVGHDFPVHYIDNEWIAGRAHRLARRLRGGPEVGWSTAVVLNYLPYIAFEWQTWKEFAPRLRAHEFDIVHRLSPMSPTLPSWIAHKLDDVPFVIGPLNGSLPWPNLFASEQRREKEYMHIVRGLYRFLPFVRSTYSRAAAVLAAFTHTCAELERVGNRVVMFPEVGYDPEIFFPGAPRRRAIGETLTFLCVGRLVPVKLPELPLRAFAGSKSLRRHRLLVIGDGPDMPRLRAFIEEHHLDDCVKLVGKRTQMEVASAMRSSDVFVFPSIRELGAGAVVEAMASGLACIVTDYGAPAALCAHGRGIRIPLAPFDDLVSSFRQAMENVVCDPVSLSSIAESGREYACSHYPWSAKGRSTKAIYDAVLAGTSLPSLGYDLSPH